MSRICGIVATGPNNEIGASGRLLYPNKTDMAFFCGYTQGKLLVMGRKTTETILGTLPGRDVICVSRDKERAMKSSSCVGGYWDGVDKNDLIRYARGRDIVVVGGGEVYNMFIGMYDEVYVTENTQLYDGRYGAADAFFDYRCLLGLTSTETVFTDKSAQFSIVKYSK